MYHPLFWNSSDSHICPLLRFFVRSLVIDWWNRCLPKKLGNANTRSHNYPVGLVTRAIQPQKNGWTNLLNNYLRFQAWYGFHGPRSILSSAKTTVSTWIGTTKIVKTTASLVWALSLFKKTRKAIIADQGFSADETSVSDGVFDL